MAGATRERKKLLKMMDSLNNVLDFYAKKFPELGEELNRLRLDIRLISKGTPIDVPLDPAASEPVLTHSPAYNEQQYNAYTVLLKAAYRKTSMLCHPDRPGGSAELFAELTDAYAMRDLSKMTLLYTTLSAGRNLYWQQSEAGIEHASTELDRPQTQLSLMKTSPAFAIGRYHAVGATYMAEQAMERHLRTEIQTLLNEIQHLTRNKNENQSESSTSENLEQDGERSEGQGEGQTEVG